MNKLQAMEIFVRVVEMGGMTRAAGSLQIPKATATTLIQQLEAALGVKLLNRTTRRVSVTADGAAYYPRCVAILAEVRETEESLGQRHSSPQGRLRVEVPTLMARLVIVPALPSFFARYPDIELQLGCSERRADLIEEGIDCAVWSGDLDDSTLIARRVGELYFGTCASPAYVAAFGQPRHPDELKKHRCINHFSPRTGKIFDWVFAKNGARIQASLRRFPPSCSRNRWRGAASRCYWATGSLNPRRSTSCIRRIGIYRARSECSSTGSPNSSTNMMASSCAPRCANDPEIRAAAPAHIMFFSA
jgi:LysR family transcriptional regulator for bpeEF and oprC